MNNSGSSVTLPVSNRSEAVVCPKPRRVGVRNSIDDHDVRSLGSQLSLQAELTESNPRSNLLDIILPKDGDTVVEQDSPEELASSPPFFWGSPPCRVANPITQDARFRDGVVFMAPTLPFPLPTPLPPSSPSGRTGGCVRASFGNNPAVRIVGFDRLDRDRRSSIPALA